MKFWEKKKKFKTVKIFRVFKENQAKKNQDKKNYLEISEIFLKL